jgi:hypothetical protein
MILSGVADANPDASRSNTNGRRLRVSPSRVALSAIGAALALVLLAAVLALVAFVAERIASDATEEWVRQVMAAFFVVAGVCVLGTLVATAVARDSVRRVPGARATTILLEWLGGAALWTIVGYAALLGGGIALVVFIVGGTAAAGFLLYLVAKLFSFLFGISLRWGLVMASGLLFVVSASGGLIHDIRLEVMPPHAPPKEHE